MFKDFDFKARTLIGADNSLEKKDIQQNRSQKTSETRDGSDNLRDSKEEFSSAIKRFNNELSWKPQRINPHKEDAASKFASNIAHLIKSKNHNRRTTSYVDFRISEETDEEDSVSE